MNQGSRQKGSESEHKEIDYTDDGWLYDLIDAKDWNAALSLLAFKTQAHEQTLVELISQRQHSPLWDIAQKNNNLCGSAKDLCLRLIDIGGEEVVKRVATDFRDENLTVLHLICKYKFTGDPLCQADEGNWLEIITKLIEVGGVEYLSMDDLRGNTALSYACSPEGHRNPAIVRRLLELGAKIGCSYEGNFNLFAMRQLQLGEENILFSTDLKKKLKSSVLQSALFLTCIRREQEHAMEIIQLLLEFGGKRLVFMTDTNGCTALHYAICLGGENCAEIIRRIVAIGGEKLILMTTEFGHNFLDHAQLSLSGLEMEQIIDVLFDVGGIELFRMVGGTALLYLFYKGRQPERWPAIVDRLLEAGGDKLLLETMDFYGTSPFHYLCLNSGQFSPQIETQLETMFKKLIEIGGKKMVMAHDRSGQTALHYACSIIIGESTLRVIEELIEVGGEELLFISTGECATPLHNACAGRNTPFREQAINRLLDIGRKKLLFMTTRRINRTAIEVERNKVEPSQQVLDRFLEIGGEEARNLITTARHVVEQEQNENE